MGTSQVTVSSVFSGLTLTKMPAILGQPQANFATALVVLGMLSSILS